MDFADFGDFRDFPDLDFGLLVDFTLVVVDFTEVVSKDRVLSGTVETPSTDSPSLEIFFFFFFFFDEGLFVAVLPDLILETEAVSRFSPSSFAFIFFFVFFVPLDCSFDEAVDTTVVVFNPLLDLSSDCSLNSGELPSSFLETFFFFFFFVPLDFGLDEGDDSIVVVGVSLFDTLFVSTFLWSDCALDTEGASTEGASPVSPPLLVAGLFSSVLVTSDSDFNGDKNSSVVFSAPALVDSSTASALTPTG